MPFIVIGIGIIIAIVVLGLLVLPSFVDEQQIIALAQEQVRKSTGGELRVDGETTLALLPALSIVLNNTVIDLPAQSDEGGRTLASVGSLDIGLSFISVLMGRTEVGEIMLSDTDVQLFNADGTLASRLTLPMLVADGLNIANSPMRLSTRLQIANLEGGEPISVALDGTLRIPQALDRIQLDALQTDISGVLTETVKTTLSGVIELSPLSAKLDLVAQLPGGDIDGDLHYASSNSPQIDLTFAAQQLDLDQLVPAGSATAADKSSPENPAKSTLQPPPIPIPVGPLRNLDLRLAVTADALTTHGQTISDAQLLFRVVDGVSDMQYLRGVLHEGLLETAMTIDVRQPNIEVNLKGGLKGVNIDSLVTNLGMAKTAVGRVNMNWHIQTKGMTTEALQLGLDGEMTVEGGNIELLPVSIQAKICKGIARLNKEPLTSTLPTTTPISALNTQIVFANQQARINKLQLATPGVAMSGKGAASLRDLNFQLTMEAAITEELQALDNACRVEARYLAIDWPAKCAGNLTGEPGEWCAIDLDTIVKQLLENEAKSKLQKKAGSVLKKLFGG